MRVSILLSAAVLLLGTSAAAEIFTGRDGLSFSLARGEATRPEDADLEVRAEGVWAKYGVAYQVKYEQGVNVAVR